MGCDAVGNKEHDHHEQFDEVERDDVHGGDDGNQRQQSLDGTVELLGFTGLTVTYSPDGGVNTCTAGLGPIYLLLGIGCVVLGLRR